MTGAWLLLLALALPAGSDNAGCLTCHSSPAFHAAAGATIYLDPDLYRRSIHGALDCRACHSDADTAPHPRPPAAVNCTGCHDDHRRAPDGFHAQSLTGVRLVTDAAGLRVVIPPPGPASVPDRACRACHDGRAAPAPPAIPPGTPHASRLCVDCHPDAGVPHPGGVGPVSCARCHVDEGGAFVSTVHGRRLDAGDPRAPGCVNCHGAHTLRAPTDPLATVYPTRVAATCLACHGDPSFRSSSPIAHHLNADSYAASVHGRPAPARGLAIAATCVDCHGAHTIRPRTEPQSSVSIQRQARTCGRCHAPEAADYLASAHGLAAAGGAHEVPVCTDCHGEHAILAHTDPRAATYRLAIAQDLCLGCHERKALQDKFGLPGQRGATYLDSYHGLATRGRSTTAAVCTDCHGIHLILGAADPASTIHPARRTATCGRCHADADARFAAAGDIHVTYGDHWLTNLVRWVYRFLIAGTLGGMLVWVLLLVFRDVRRRLAASLDDAPRRFTVPEIIQHALLTLAFIILVVTGFALAYPDAGWVQFLAQAGLLTEARRGVVHRVAGVVLVLTGLFHLGALVLTRRGRWLLARLVPQWFDVRTALQHLLYALGLRRAAPHFRFFAYFEKAEYWALIWGTAIMAATGFVLWWPESLPRLLVQVGEAIHFYEAVLAAGAILVWHSFFVIFDPEIFPLNPAMLTGRAPRGTELAERTESEAGTGAKRGVAGSGPGADLTKTG